MNYMLLKGPDVCTCHHFLKLLGIAKAIDWDFYGIGFGPDELEAVQGWTSYDSGTKQASGDFVQIYPIIDNAKYDSTTALIQNEINAGPGSMEKINLSRRNSYKNNVSVSLAAHVADNPVAL